MVVAAAQRREERFSRVSQKLSIDEHAGQENRRYCSHLLRVHAYGRLAMSPMRLDNVAQTARGAGRVGRQDGAADVRRATRVGESFTCAVRRSRSVIRSISSRAALAPICRPSWSTLVSEIGPNAA